SGLLDLQHVAALVDHAAVLRRVRDRDGLVPVPEAEPARALRVTRRATEAAAQQRQADCFASFGFSFSFRHDSTLSRESLRRSCRASAICVGERMPANAFIVARTTLIGLRE